MSYNYGIQINLNGYMANHNFALVRDIKTGRIVSSAKVSPNGKFIPILTVHDGQTIELYKVKRNNGTTL